jgi:hypothetical protein
MKPAMGGYTLLEVMLFLAISTVLFAISGVVLQGQGARTEFIASMNDVNSKMQQWIDEVNNGYSGSTANSSSAVGNYNCDLDVSDNPQLSFPGGPGPGAGKAIGTNLNCVFLGKAIMVNDEVGAGPKDFNNKIYAYTVLGRRTYTDAQGDVVNVDNLLHANPAAAVFDTGGSPSPDINLTETYTIPNGTRVRHVWAAATPGQTNGLAGFYINPTSATNAVIAVQYPLNGNIDPTDWNGTAWNIPKCIGLNFPSGGCIRGGTPDNLWPMDEWDICFESTRDNEAALLRVISSGGSGAVTKMQLGKAGGTCVQ